MADFYECVVMLLCGAVILINIPIKQNLTIHV